MKAVDAIGPVVIAALIVAPATMAYKTLNLRTARVTIISASNPDASGLTTVEVMREDRYGMKRNCSVTLKVETEDAAKRVGVTPISDSCGTVNP